MKYTFFSFLLPFCLLANFEKAFAAEAESQSSPNRSWKSSQVASFDTVSKKLVNRQINLIYRIQKALSEPDPNRMRAVGGQLITHTVVVESFLKSQYPKPQALCNQNQSQEASVDLIPPISPSSSKVYCSLYNSSRELSKLTPILDRLLSRRGELAIVRELPLVSGEKQSDLVLPMSPISRPNLGKLATPYAILEPSVEPDASLIIGKRKKRARTRNAGALNANYVPPVQPAIKPPTEALKILTNAEKYLATAISVLPVENNIPNPEKMTAEFNRLAYDVDLQEKQTYRKLLLMPNTGIFRVLPHQAYLRPLNTVENRSQKNILDRYPFPVLGKPKGNFTPNLPLQIVKGKFQLQSQGVDYGFMAEIGDLPLEKLDANLRTVDPKKRNNLVNYQPPSKLSALLTEKRKIITGKHKNFNVNVKLNHTYLVRNLQFQLPEIIANNQVISGKQRRYLDQLLQMQSSDIIVAFRPVRRHSDGSYTVTWRVLQQLKDPQIEDLEDYLKFQK
ncbi:MAG: hypothetical protein WA959_21930 [Rivularia sp. (in: cyanobacteria)]